MTKLIRSSPIAILIVLATSAALACAAPQDTSSEAEMQPGADESLAAARQQNAEVSCGMRFTMEGWSAIIQKAEGEGVVTCDNGQTANVKIEVIGGGLTVGKTTIDEGEGTFSKVKDISEIFGSYAQAEASAGAVEAVSAQALTKGEVSLVITTEGRGWSLGISGAKFTIERVAEPA